MLAFGSPEANAVLTADKALALEREEGIEPIRRWLVTVEITRDESFYIDARTADEAIELCRRRYPGEPYDAELAKEV